MTTLLLVCVVVCVLLAGKGVEWAARCVSAHKTNRLVYINEAWRQAFCQTIHYGTQHTLAQEQAMLRDIYDELGITCEWTSEEIEDYEKHLAAPRR